MLRRLWQPSKSMRWSLFSEIVTNFRTAELIIRVENEIQFINQKILILYIKFR